MPYLCIFHNSREPGVQWQIPRSGDFNQITFEHVLYRNVFSSVEPQREHETEALPLEIVIF